MQAHGTAFGYRLDGNDTLLVTNDHVATWPAATDADHPVDGVAAGCRRVSNGIKIVDDDHDTYAADDIPLSLVVTDPALDVAVLRAHQKLPIMPWKIGSSAALATRDVVQIKGFPLGEFAATNVGKVISTYDHDEQGDWNHDDFVVDALVSSGNSGSPVLAVSCKTGEFELVGIFHAHYNNASALNVVISIDQVRDLLATLKRSTHKPDAIALDMAARDALAHAIATDSDPPFFAFGSLTASVHARPDGAFVFALFGSDFPRTTRPLLVLEDPRPPASSARSARSTPANPAASCRSPRSAPTMRAASDGRSTRSAATHSRRSSCATRRRRPRARRSSSPTPSARRSNTCSTASATRSRRSPTSRVARPPARPIRRFRYRASRPRREQRPSTEARYAPSRMTALELFATVFGVIFVAELPDKTALAALVLATRHRPLPVWLGASLALTVQSAVAVGAGSLFPHCRAATSRSARACCSSRAPCSCGSARPRTTSDD